MATVPGGEFNHADGAYSFAAGRRVHANHAGSFKSLNGTVEKQGRQIAKDAVEVLGNRTEMPYAWLGLVAPCGHGQIGDLAEVTARLSRLAVVTAPEAICGFG